MTSPFLHNLTLLLTSRLLTFSLSLLTLRLTPVQTIGTVAIDLELHLATVLFLSREGVRLTMIKGWYGECVGNRGWPRKSFLNVAYVPSLICTMFLLCGGVWNIKSLSSLHSLNDTDTDNDNDDKHYPLVSIFYTLSALFETLSEPYIISSLSQTPLPNDKKNTTGGDQSVRAKSESFAAIAKSFTLIGLLLTATCESSLLAFGLAQVVYGMTFLLTARFYEMSRIKSLSTTTPSLSFQPSSQPLFDLPTIHTSLIFTLQSLAKHILTYGDSLVLKLLSSKYDKGVYAMASSYGGLPARLILAPIEEMSRTVFSSSSSNVSDESKLYSTLCKVSIYIGLLFTFFAPPYVSILLKVIAGERYNTAQCNDALSAFCYYTLFIAFNGTSEAYLYAKMSKDDVVEGAMGMVMLGSGVCFAVIAGVLVGVGGMGAKGLVVGNVLQMIIRGWYATNWNVVRITGEQQEADKEKVKGHQYFFQNCTPEFKVWSYFFVAGVIMRASKEVVLTSLKVKAVAGHVLIGGVLFIGLVLVVWVFEKEFLQDLQGIFGKKKEKEEYAGKKKED